MRISILGFGLIGGSLARAIRRDSATAALGETPFIGAWSPTGHGPSRALTDGIIDRGFASADEAIEGADLIVLAGPPLACLDLLETMGGREAAGLGHTATVTDVASTKGLLVTTADRGGLRFVGGHPMAGRETSGYETASAELFEGRPWVLVPGMHARDIDIDRVERLVRAAGATPRTMTAEEHDSAVAGISHLPLLVSAALVEAVAGGATPRPGWPTAQSLAASGWAGMTRLARGDIEMGVGIVATNAVAVASRLRDLQVVLDEWLADLDALAAAEVVTASLPNTDERLPPDEAVRLAQLNPTDGAAGSGTEPQVERLRERLRQARAVLESKS